MRQAIDQLVDPPTLAQRLLRTSAELLVVSVDAIEVVLGQLLGADVSAAERVSLFDCGEVVELGHVVPVVTMSPSQGPISSRGHGRESQSC